MPKWNSSTPAGNSYLGDGAKILRELKETFKNMYETEHEGIPVSFTSMGKHKQGSLKASWKINPLSPYTNRILLYTGVDPPTTTEINRYKNFNTLKICLNENLQYDYAYKPARGKYLTLTSGQIIGETGFTLPPPYNWFWRYVFLKDYECLTLYRNDTNDEYGDLSLLHYSVSAYNDYIRLYFEFPTVGTNFICDVYLEIGRKLEYDNSEYIMQYITTITATLPSNTYFYDFNIYTTFLRGVRILPFTQYQTGYETSYKNSLTMALVCAPRLDGNRASKGQVWNSVNGIKFYSCVLKG